MSPLYGLGSPGSNRGDGPSGTLGGRPPGAGPAVPAPWDVLLGDDRHPGPPDGRRGERVHPASMIAWHVGATKPFGAVLLCDRFSRVFHQCKVFVLSFHASILDFDFNFIMHSFSRFPFKSFIISAYDNVPSRRRD